MVSCKPSSRFRLLLVAAAVAQPLAFPAHAADEAQRIDQLEKQLARSMAVIEQLSRRLNQLEASQASAPAPAAAAAPAPTQDARNERLEQAVTGI
jgi:cell division protein FtsB